MSSAGESAARPRLRVAEPGADLGRYHLIEELGAGGMASVFLARDHKLRREVAVKVLFPHLARKPEVVARFHREARAVAALDHRHILKVFDVGGGEGVDGDDGARPVDPPYIVLELSRGPSLEKLVSDGRPLAAEGVAAVGVAVCQALGQAHAAGVIHRDVKPANLLVADDGRLLLSDFGVARIEDDSVVTRTGAVLGTPAFMSPEQATGGELDARSDLYSLGATLYQLATGSLPVTGGAARAVAAIVSGDVVPPLRRNPRMGPDLARVIERLMKADPAERYPDAGAVEAALREVVEAGGGGDPAALLGELFADREACETRLARSAVTASLAGARRALGGGQVARALALCDRALALEPDSREALELVDSIGRGRVRRRLVMAGLGLAVAGVVGVGAWRIWPAPAAGQGGQARAEDAAAEVLAQVERPVAPADGGTEVAATDAGAGAGADPALARADAAVRVSDPGGRSRRRRVSHPVASSGPLVPARLPDAGTDAAVVAPELARPATLIVTADTWCDVVLDGKTLGRAGRVPAQRVATGHHDVSCTQGAGGRSFSIKVDLAPGERRTVRAVLLPEVAIHLALRRGDAIRIAGRLHANGATVRLRAGHYFPVEVLRGGQRVLRDGLDVPAVKACTLEDSPQLGCLAGRRP